MRRPVPMRRSCRVGGEPARRRRCSTRCARCGHCGAADGCDLLAALLVGTLVTEAVFELPGPGSVLRDAATRPDPHAARALFVVSVIAVIGAIVFVPATGTAWPTSRAGPRTGGAPRVARSRRCGCWRSWWRWSPVAHLGLAPAGRIGNRVGEACRPATRWEPTRSVATCSRACWRRPGARCSSSWPR